MVSKQGFKGPVFIVGMPRSGTKLLRELLNNHSMIGIAINESKCLPYFYKNRQRFGNFASPEGFGAFYKEFSQTTFFERITQQNNFIDEETWFREIKDWSYPSVVKAFYLEYAKCEGKIIWGDKTPSYLIEIPLLKSLFPDAKFIHIIRDARDYCLSIRSAWNKNIYRAAQRWSDCIIKCRTDAQNICPLDYIEIKYEDLLSDTKCCMEKLLDFIQVPYEESVLQVTRTTENLGKAKDSVGIVKLNYGHWKNDLDKKSLEKIEGICGRLLEKLGYEIENNRNTKRLHGYEMLYFKIIDSINVIAYEMQTNTVKKTLKNLLKHKVI